MKKAILLATALGAFSAQAQLETKYVSCEGTVAKTGEKVGVEFCYAKGIGLSNGATTVGPIIPCSEKDLALVGIANNEVLNAEDFVIGAASNYRQVDDSINLVITKANSEEQERADNISVTITAEMEFSSLAVTLFRTAADGRNYYLNYSFEKATCTQTDITDPVSDEAAATGVPGNDVLEGEPVGLPADPSEQTDDGIPAFEEPDQEQDDGIPTLEEPAPAGVPTIDERGRPTLPPPPQN